MRQLFTFFTGCRNHGPHAFICAFAMLVLSAAVPRAESEIFPVPGILKHNVAFWIRIYTEISLKEGLLHDRDYPQLVYEKVVSGDRTGKTKSDFIDGRRTIYADAIAAVRDSAPSTWGTVEKRVAELFKSLPDIPIEDAENRIRHQMGQRERFKQGVERSSVYLDTIAAILKTHNVPDELKYLPHVESSFDYEAYSKVGAAGLWQFMRATGRGYMKIDYMLDERRDPVISTEAAAKFLRGNYDMLKTWPLAITAYNHGPNGMRRAVETVGSRDIAVILEKHESRTFRFASKNFYACFLAVLQIMEEPEKYIKGKINYQPKWQATTIKLQDAVKPADLIKALGVTEQEFKKLNRSFRPVVFTQQMTIPAGHLINIPHTAAANDALAAIKSSAPPPTQRAAAAAASTEYYTVLRGDNLQGIARRLGIQMAQLAAENNITNSSRIYVGQVLRIPSSSTVPAPVTAAAAPPARDTAKTVTVAAASTRDTAKTKTAATASSTGGTAKPEPAVLSKADTIQSAPAVSSARGAPKTVTPAAKTDAAKSDTILTDTLSAAALTEAAPEPAKPGPSGKPAADTRFDASVYDLDMTVAAGGSSASVRVSVDETIGHFAEWTGTGVNEIRRMNSLGPNATVQMGRTIRIPIKSAANIKKFEVSRLQYHMAIEEDFFARYNIVDFERKKVKSGENLWRICREAQIPMWLLKKFNKGVKFYNLQTGNMLWIPKTAPKEGTTEPPNEFDPVVTDSDE